MPHKLTNQQSKALEFIRNSFDRAGTSPTLRELCRHMGYSAIGSAQDVVAALRKKGYLQVPDKQSARSLILLERPANQVSETVSLDANVFSIHCLGSVPAGNPLEAVEERIGTLRMSISMFPRPYPDEKSLFAVRAIGTSMVDAGILDGDWLVVQHAVEAHEGDIVVARFGDDSTVKRLMKDRRGWYLKPENSTYPLMRATSDEPFEIVGKVVGLQRTFRF